MKRLVVEPNNSHQKPKKIVRIADPDQLWSFSLN